MPYRRCGHSGLLLPEISLGLWQNFGDGAEPAQARAVIARAIDKGVTHFDLANNYGPPPGAAEERFGALLEKEFFSLRDQLVISSKAGHLMWPGPYGQGGSRKHLLASLDQSLKRLRLDYVDIFYSHRFDPDTPLEETMGALETAVKSGKALYAGISNYTAAQSAEACRLLKGAGVPCLVHQGLFNLLQSRSEDVVDAVENLGIGFVAFSPLAQGLLSERYAGGIPADSRAAREGADSPLYQRALTEQPKIAAFEKIARSRGQSLAQMALSWLLHFPQLTSVITGARNVGQLDEQLAAAGNSQFSPQELRQIEAIRLGGDPQPSRTVVA